MSPKDNTSESRIDRRTVLRASGASITGGFGATIAAGNPGENGSHKAVYRREREPDVKIVDNSKSDGAVVLRYRRCPKNQNNGTLPADENEGMDDERGPVIAKTEVSTKGLNHPDFKPVRNELTGTDANTQSLQELTSRLEKRTEESRATVERITETENEQISVEVRYQGNSDSALLNIGGNGASKEETVSVHIGTDGSVSASTRVSCVNI